MKILLDYKIEIEVREGNKKKESLSVFYREFSRDELNEQKATKKQFMDIYKKAQKIEKKKSSLVKRAELLELSGEYEKSIVALDEIEKLESKSDSLVDELESIGGEDQDSFSDELAKKRFETLVSGADKDTLKSYAEIKGYVELMRSLDVAKAELEKKQSGE